MIFTAASFSSGRSCRANFGERRCANYYHNSLAFFRPWSSDLQYERNGSTTNPPTRQAQHGDNT